MAYNQTLFKLFEILKTSNDGLSSSEAYLRLKAFGPNELQEKKKRSAWKQLLAQFRDFMIIVLLTAAVLSAFMGDLTDAIIIIVIVLINAIIGFVQEYNAEKAMEALRKLSIVRAHVLRDGHSTVISSLDIVPGDVVIIEAGNVVPADIRLLETHSLRIDESSLTGESIPVEKNHTDLSIENLPIADQHNMVFKGTLVNNGRAKGLVTATGMNTELGKIAGLLQQEDVMTPLQARMTAFGKRLTIIILLICTVLFITGIIRGEEPYKILLISISLAVAAIPEALPAMIAITLARGASILARKNAIARNLPSVETLGSVSFICSDKTGTLTLNKMKVVDRLDNHSYLDLCIALNHDVQFDDLNRILGESTEMALVENVVSRLKYEGYHSLIKPYPRIAEIPFDSERKCMTTVHTYGDQYLIVTKGASEAIAMKISKVEELETLHTYSEAWANEGKRVLAYAYKILDQPPANILAESLETNLALAGMVALMDPPREEVKAAIAECKTAGIKPVMITGDHPATAKSIAKEIGILEENDVVVTGKELQKMSEESFYKQVEQIAVYARVSPDQKLRIVRALQSKGHFVAMTGDGVNDAPSLKAANIGVAMGINGTDVSKEAADIILLDDNFATIERAVKEGRRIFDNIRKFIKYTMTSNAGEIWTIFLAPLIGLPIPLMPIHILWINLVTDGLPGLALVSEGAERNIMQRPPRKPDESIFSQGLGWHILWVGLLMGAVCLGAQAWAMQHHDPKWQTYVFTILCFSQMGHVYAIRSQHSYLFQQGFFSNLPLAGAVLSTFLLQLSLLYVPFFQEIFSIQPLSLKELGACILISLIVFHAVEFEKWFQHRLKKMNQKN